MNAKYPTEQQLAAMLVQAGPNEPISMVNLLRFKERAEYKPKHANYNKNLTGREAYKLYSTGIAKIVHDMGGKVVYTSDITGIFVAWMLLF